MSPNEERTRSDTATSDVTLHIPSPPHPELRRLDPLVGSWTARDHTIDGPGGPNALVELEESFRWLEGGYFLESRYRVAFGDLPTSLGVMYWGYDDAAGVFRQIYFNDQGPFDEELSRYAGVVESGALTFTGPARVRYPLADDGGVKVNADGTIDARWWLPDGEGGWSPWRDVHYQPAP